MFAIIKKDKLILLILYAQETTILFSAILFMNSFVWVTSYVTSYLLMFARIISIMFMFLVLWSQHNMFYICLIKIMLGMSPQKLFVLSLTYSRTSRR